MGRVAEDLRPMWPGLHDGEIEVKTQEEEQKLLPEATRKENEKPAHRNVSLP